VAVEVTREGEGSKFVQTVRLSAGDSGNRVEFSDSIDWRALAANLKVVFPLSAANKMATYNWEIGTIERPVAQERQFEVAPHYWIDQTDESGSFGATILTDVKNGSDKRDDRTIRLTLLRSPGEASEMRGDCIDQLNQDWGHHEILFGIAGHAGDWREGKTDWQAYRLSTPLIAFDTEKHAGPLGHSFSLLSVDNMHIRILALKKAELGDEVIIRLVELDGQPAPRVRVKFARPIATAREVNGQELPVGSATIVDGALETFFKPFQPRTFALRLSPSPVRITGIESHPVALRYDLAAASEDDTKSTGGFDKQGNALPAEMLPTERRWRGLPSGSCRSGQARCPGGERSDDRSAGGQLQQGVRACRFGSRRPASSLPRRHASRKADNRGLGRIHRAMGHADLEARAGYGNRRRRFPRSSSRAAGFAEEGLGGIGKSRRLGPRESRFAELGTKVSGRLHRPPAGLHQAGNSGVVRLASSHPRGTESAVRLQLSLRLRDRFALKSQDADPTGK
jgi:hypothetical protein